MFEFIFNNSRSKILFNNSRQSIGSNKNYAINKHASWQQSFNKRTLGATSSCDSCATANCPSNYWSENTTSSNGCQWQCPTGLGSYYYCNGIPRQF